MLLLQLFVIGITKSATKTKRLGFEWISLAFL